LGCRVVDQEGEYRPCSIRDLDLNQWSRAAPSPSAKANETWRLIQTLVLFDISNHSADNLAMERSDPVSSPRFVETPIKAGGV